MTSFRRIAPALALPLLALAFVALVALASLLPRGARLDLTEHRLYTLSDGTRRILGRVDEPVRLKLYYSEHAARELPQFRVFAQRVIELLQEMSAASHGKVTLEIVDPEPFSDAEDQAAEHGLQALPLGTNGEGLYFGLVGSNSTDGETTMPFIQPDKESFLEYDLAKLISTLSVDVKPVVALLGDLPTGPGVDAATGQPSMGYVIDQQLAELFELRRMQPGPSSIADDVDLLMLVHPKDLPAPTLEAIDQFVLRGGRLLVFVDPDAESDPAGSGMDPMAMSEDRSSDVPTLFKAWGIQYDPTRVVLDSRYALQVQPSPSAPALRHLEVLGLHRDTLNQKDVVSADLENLNLSSAGALSLAAGSPLKIEPLVQSSPDSALVDREAVRAAASDPRQISDAFRPDGKGPYLLAARFSGMLRSAFPQSKAPGHLARSAKTANIIVVADTDVLNDRMWVQATQDVFGQRNYNAFANNGDFVYNAVDNLVGNIDLIGVRTRAASTRPFERVEVMRRTAEQRFRTEEKQLQDQLAQLEEKLQRLQPATPGVATQLTREQQAEVLEFQKQRAQARKQLRDVQHQLNSDIEALGSWLKFVNILLVPLLLVMIGLAVACRRLVADARAAGQPPGGWEILGAVAAFVVIAALTRLVMVLMGLGPLAQVLLSATFGAGAGVAVLAILTRLKRNRLPIHA
jgi:ABC-type uncharacterized transport system involved in gliding motility auxiliary subunit